MVSGLLSLVLWLPLAGALVLLAVPRDRLETIRTVTLVVALADLAAAVCAAAVVGLAHTGALQFQERVSWIPSVGISYHLGATG